MTTPSELADAIEARLAPLATEAGRAWWDASVDASPHHDERRVAAEIAYADALADPDTFATLRNVLAAVDPTVEPELHRRLVLLHNEFVGNQVDPALMERLIQLGAEVDSAFSAFRGTVGDRNLNDNEINATLRDSDDSGERRQAWDASKQVGAEVADRVLELVRLRNEIAVGLGYRDHFAMSLALTELDEDVVFSVLDDVDRVSAEPFARWKSGVDTRLAERFGCGLGDLRPWHYDNVFFQSPPAGSGADLDAWYRGRDLVDLTARTYAGIGLDIAPILARSDLEPRDGKNQHAFCVDIDRSGDVRVLCNNVPTEEWAEVMLHEFGHAVYSAGTDPQLPWSLRTMHSLVTEGVAMMFEQLSKEPAWLTGIVGIDAPVVDAVRPQLVEGFRGGLLTFCRWVLVMTNFERGLYADPDADHNTRWWDLVERYQLLRRPEGRSAPDWAAKIHIASAPVYYQNYLLGQLVALQLADTLTTRFGGLIDHPGVGRFLADEVFGPGASIRWDHLVERATGHPLTAEHLAAAVAGGVDA